MIERGPFDALAGQGLAVPGQLGSPLPSARPVGLALVTGAAAVVIVAAGLRTVSWLVGPVMLALVVVIVVRPVERWLRSRWVLRWVAVFVLVAAVYAVVVAFAGIVVASLAQLVTLLPRYRDEAEILLGSVLALLRDNGVSPVPLAELAASFDLGRLIAVIGLVLAGAAGLAGNVVFLLSVMLFLALESGGFRARLGVIARMRPLMAEALERFVHGTRRFLVVTTVFGLLTAVVDTVLLLALGIPLAVVWGLLAFVTNYIPYVGFFLGVVPPAVLALLEGGWPTLLLVVVLYVLVNFVLCSLVQPRFIGDAVGISLTVVFLSLGLWGWVLGPLGAVLAVPLTLLVKAVLLEADARTAWIGSLLGARVEPVVAGPAPPDPTEVDGVG